MKRTVLMVGVTLMSMNLHSQDQSNNVVLTDTIINTPLISSENTGTPKDSLADNCINGAMDAEMFHGKKGGAFVLGFLFGPFALIGTSASDPTPERGKDTYILSSNKDQFKEPHYRRCYRNRVRKSLTRSAALGWLTEIVLAVGLLFY